MAFSQQAFPTPSKLKCWPTYTSYDVGLPAGSTSPGTAMLSGFCAPARVQLMPAMRREPLCLLRVLPFEGWRLPPPREALPSPHRSYGLMRRTKTLPHTPALASLGGSLQVAASPCWEMALPDVISAILVQLSGPIPRRNLPVHLSASSRKTSASRYGSIVRLAKISLQSNFNRDRDFGAAVIR